VAEKVGSDEYQSNKVRLSFLSSIIIGATRFSLLSFSSHYYATTDTLDTDMTEPRYHRSVYSFGLSGNSETLPGRYCLSLYLCCCSHFSGCSTLLLMEARHPEPFKATTSLHCTPYRHLRWWGMCQAWMNQTSLQGFLPRS
jgi:hypothetical protein